MLEIDQVHLRAVMLCMSETSEIIIIFNIHRIWWYGWKALRLSFSKLFRIENPLNIKQVMSKNVSDNNNAAMLLMSHVRDIRDVKWSKATLYKVMLLMSEMSEIWNISMLCNYCIEIFHISNISNMSNIAVYSVAFDLLLRYFTSPTSPTCIALILCIDYID